MTGNVVEQVPPSWATPLVAEVGSVRLGRQRSPSKVSGRHATPYLRAGNIVEHGLDLTDVLEMDFDPRERETYALRDGDVLLAEASGSPKHVGRPAIWRDELPLCCIQNTVIRFRPHAVWPEYALAVFRHYAASGVFARTARGSGLLHLGAGRFGALPFPLPPMAEQQRIVAVLDADRARSSADCARGGAQRNL
jgi:type I restriction enzyme, S subunit